jgi:GTPase SAR1 family protein
MIIGNHSAGKSSFINWYIGESVQTTGVVGLHRLIPVDIYVAWKAPGFNP